jgi:hypothetical protein
MSSAMATQQFAANVLRTGARKAGRSAPVRANRMTVRAAASNGGLPIDLRGAFPTDSFASPAPHSTVPAHRRGRDPSRKRASRGTRIDPSRVFGRRARSAPSPARARAKNRASRAIRRGPDRETTFLRNHRSLLSSSTRFALAD